MFTQLIHIPLPKLPLLNFRTENSVPKSGHYNTNYKNTIIIIITILLTETKNEKINVETSIPLGTKLPYPS